MRKLFMCMLVMIMVATIMTSCGKDTTCSTCDGSGGYPCLAKKVAMQLSGTDHAGHDCGQCNNGWSTCTACGGSGVAED